MKKEYDFKKAERGKFYKPGVKINTPIYLDEKTYAFINRLAQRRNMDLSSIVNQILHSDMQLANTLAESQ